jgi:hypothetical protein
MVKKINRVNDMLEDSIIYLFDNFGFHICQYCEKKIICGSSMSSTYLCEGRHCKDAIASIEVSDDVNVIEVKRNIRRIKLKNINDNQ